MNIPYSVVVAGKTEEYVELVKELDKHKKIHFEAWSICDELERQIRETVTKKINTYLPNSAHSDFEKRITWNKAVKLYELSQQFLEYAGQYQESATIVERLEKKLGELANLN